MKRITLALEHYFHLLSEQDNMAYASPKLLFPLPLLVGWRNVKRKDNGLLEVEVQHRLISTLLWLICLCHASQKFRQKLRASSSSTKYSWQR